MHGGTTNLRRWTSKHVRARRMGGMKGPVTLDIWRSPQRQTHPPTRRACDPRDGAFSKTDEMAQNLAKGYPGRGARQSENWGNGARGRQAEKKRRADVLYQKTDRDAPIEQRNKRSATLGESTFRAPTKHAS